MNTSILHTEIQEFINQNLKSDVSKLLLKGTTFKNVSTKAIIEQIEAKKRSEKKLPTWFNAQNIYFPNKLNIEQTSSEVTAQFKTKIISGSSIIDITGGFGIDCYYFAKHFKSVTHCEINTQLSQIVAHNYTQLGVKNIETINANGIEYLKSTNNTFDCIYIDPSRRHDSKGKVFFLNDCLPNVPEHLELLFSKTETILIKTSPLLDITVGLSELKHVQTIYSVAVNNEVKELLWLLKRNFNEDITIETVNIKKEKAEQFSFLLKNEATSIPEYSIPLLYLYEPNASILKTGAFNSVAKQFNLKKLHQHSHLYTSKAKIDFPGRVFKIEKTLAYNKKLFKNEGITKANITTRNFPDSVAQIRKKLNVKDGGDTYLFFTTDVDNNKVVLVCKKA